MPVAIQPEGGLRCRPKAPLGRTEQARPELTNRPAGTHKRTALRNTAAILSENKQLLISMRRADYYTATDISRHFLTAVLVLCTLRTQHVPLCVPAERFVSSGRFGPDLRTPIRARDCSVASEAGQTSDQTCDAMHSGRFCLRSRGRPQTSTDVTMPSGRQTPCPVTSL